MLFQQALDEQSAGRHDKAIRLFEMIVAVMPSHVGALHRLGKSRMAVGQFAAAHEVIEAVLAIDPTNAEAMIDKADVFRQVGDNARAIETATRGLDVNPSSAHGYVVRAAARWSSNLRESALADIRRAVVLRPVPEVKGLLGIYLQGCGRSEEGLPHLLDAVKGDPKNPFWHKHLADCYHLRGDFLAAFREYQEAVTLDDRYVDAYCDLSGLLSSTFSYPLAESVARLAITLQPTSAGAYRNLGVALQMQKKEQDAIEAYAMALRHNPGFHNALVNMRILRDRNCDWGDREVDWKTLQEQTYRKGQQIPPSAWLPSWTIRQNIFFAHASARPQPNRLLCLALHQDQKVV